MASVDTTAVTGAISTFMGQAAKALEQNSTQLKEVLTEDQIVLFASFYASVHELINVEGGEEEREASFKRVQLAHSFLRLSTFRALSENRGEAAEVNLKIVDTAVENIGEVLSPPKKTFRERLGGLFSR